MKFLLDANLSPKVVERLVSAGHEAIHVAQLGLVTAADATIFDRAAADGYVVITADTDFSMLLAVRSVARPSVVLLRHVAELPPDVHGDLLIANLPAVLDDLEHGAVVSLAPTRLAVRRLPIA
jgi:predicted nuclease of predicted toxin-antitoxin system